VSRQTIGSSAAEPHLPFVMSQHPCMPELRPTMRTIFVAASGSAQLLKLHVAGLSHGADAGIADEPLFCG